MICVSLYLTLFSDIDIAQAIEFPEPRLRGYSKLIMQEAQAIYASDALRPAAQDARKSGVVG
jgi:hypothetical protein